MSPSTQKRNHKNIVLDTIVVINFLGTLYLGSLFMQSPVVYWYSMLGILCDDGNSIYLPTLSQLWKEHSLFKLAMELTRCLMSLVPTLNTEAWPALNTTLFSEVHLQSVKLKFDSPAKTSVSTQAHYMMPV